MASRKITEKDIQSFVKNMFGLTIAREQLMTPTKEFVVGLYSRFLEQFGMDNVSQPDLMATTGIDNIERYETVIIVTNIFRGVAKVVASAGVTDVTFADVVFPTRTQTLRILSALCSLLLQLTEIKERFNEMQSNVADLPARRLAVEQRCQKLKRTVEEKSMFLSANKSKTTAAAQQLKQLAETYEQKRLTADELHKESLTLKTAILQRREKLAEVDVEMSKMREKIQNLDKKVVKSPERIQAKTDQKEAELEAKRNKKKRLEKQYMELTRLLDLLKQGSKALMPSLETFTEAFKDIQTIRQECDKLLENKVLLNSCEEKLKSLKVQIKEKQKSCQTLRQQFLNNEKTFQQQIQSMKQIINDRKSELDTKSQKQSANDQHFLEEQLRLKKHLHELDVNYKKAKDSFAALWAKHLDTLLRFKNRTETRMNEIQIIKHQN